DLTNNIARMRTTNCTLYVSTRATNLEIASVTNGALLFSMKQGRLSISSQDGKFVRNTTNTHLLINSPSTLVHLAISNNALSITTPDHIIPQDGGDWGPKAKKPT